MTNKNTEQRHGNMGRLSGHLHNWLNLEQSSEYIKLSQRTLIRKISSGQLKAVKPARKYLIHITWLDDFALGISTGNSISITKESSSI